MDQTSLCVQNKNQQKDSTRGQVRHLPETRWCGKSKEGSGKLAWRVGLQQVSDKNKILGKNPVATQTKF